MFSMAVHGGAGSLDGTRLSPRQEADYHKALNAALLAGTSVLKAGGRALDAVEQSVRILEDDPLFNAGRGAVFNYDGVQELDAAMMCGSTLRVGAVAGVQHVRNPVSLARKVLEDPKYALLSGEGALDFARRHGLAIEEMQYFYTPERYQQLLDVKMQRLTGEADTVGAVARDAFGNLAAASSTGGLTNKRFGRIGDSPVIGAGTYASNDTCAVCCTGDGEYFIRLVTAGDVAAMLRYQGLSLQEASDIAIREKLTGLGGEGGLIAVDAAGNLSLVANCASMPRAWFRSGGDSGTAIWFNE